MRVAPFVLVVVSGMAFAGCGGSGASPSAPTEIPAPQPTPAPLPSPPPAPVPSPEPAEGFTFNIDPGVTELDQASIRDGLDLGQRFFRDAFGRPVTGSIMVRITTESGGSSAFADGSQIAFNTRHPVWTSTATVNKHKITIHELFHIYQGQSGLLNGINPRWFIEGSAEYVGFHGVSYAGLLPYDVARRCQLFSMARGVDPSLTLRAGGIPPSNGYWLAFMAIDYMTTGNVRTFAGIVNAPGSSWDTKLRAASGMSADEFFDRFEAERSRYPIPSSYECPR